MHYEKDSFQLRLLQADSQTDSETFYTYEVEERLQAFELEETNRLTCPKRILNIKTVMNKTTKTKFYVYESGEVIGEVELSKSEWNSEKVLKSVFEKYFGDVIEEEDEFEINCDEGEIYIGLNEEMYLWNVNNED